MERLMHPSLFRRPVRAVAGTAVALSALGFTVAPAATETPPAVAEVTVVTPHHAAPDGVLFGRFTVSDGCDLSLASPATTAACAGDDAVTSGTVSGTRIGLSVEHRALPAGLVGDRTEVLSVEVHEPGALTLIAELPAGSTSELVAASQATHVSARRAQWDLGHVEPGLWTFRIDTLGTPAGVSELTEVTARFVTDHLPRVESGFEPITSRTGRRVATLVLEGDRDVDGTAPTFQDQDAHFAQVVDDGDRTAFVEGYSAVSNGTYYGRLDGHVGNTYGRPAGGITVMHHGARTNHYRAPEFGLRRWQTAQEVNALPFLPHEVITPAASSLLTAPAPSLPDAATLSPQEGARPTLRLAGSHRWAVGHTTMPTLETRSDVLPSRSGVSAAVRTQELHVVAADGDIDNRDGLTDLRGEPIRFHAPVGWTFSSGILSGGNGGRVDVEFGRDIDGPFVDLFPVVRAGQYLPQTAEGQPYHAQILLDLIAYSDLTIGGQATEPTNVVATTGDRAVVTFVRTGRAPITCHLPAGHTTWDPISGCPAIPRNPR
jgi:hypothetical protein